MQFAEKQLLSNLVQTLDLQKNKDKLNDEIYLSGNFDLECVDCLLFPHHSLIKILTHHIQRDSSPNIDFVPNAFCLGLPFGFPQTVRSGALIGLSYIISTL